MGKRSRTPFSCAVCQDMLPQGWRDPLCAECAAMERETDPQGELRAAGLIPSVPPGVPAAPQAAPVVLPPAPPAASPRVPNDVLQATFADKLVSALDVITSKLAQLDKQRVACWEVMGEHDAQLKALPKLYATAEQVGKAQATADRALALLAQLTQASSPGARKPAPVTVTPPVQQSNPAPAPPIAERERAKRAAGSTDKNMPAAPQSSMGAKPVAVLAQGAPVIPTDDALRSLIPFRDALCKLAARVGIAVRETSSGARIAGYLSGKRDGGTPAECKARADKWDGVPAAPQSAPVQQSKPAAPKQSGAWTTSAGVSRATLNGTVYEVRVDGTDSQRSKNFCGLYVNGARVGGLSFRNKLIGAAEQMARGA